MIKIDCFGDICPVPIMKIEKQLKTLPDGEVLEVVTDHSCTVESVANKFKKYSVESEEVMNGVWEIRITKP
ncbi:MAG: sulfurtransferase TusA family protein [Tissierellales bacterium]|nr:sulfurtransferase TusA family protein [Tissierellales bacterium]HCX03254.1 sulfurtransferase TusA family protein [Clostridiales bacterium]